MPLGSEDFLPILSDVGTMYRNELEY